MLKVECEKLQTWTKTKNRHRLKFCSDQIKNIKNFHCSLQNFFLKKNPYSIKHHEKTALLAQNQIPVYFYLLCQHSKAYGQLNCLSGQRLWISHLGCHSCHIVSLGVVTEACDLFSQRQNGLLLYSEEKQSRKKMLLSVLREQHHLYVTVAHFQ